MKDSTGTNLLKVITERIPVRLADIKTLTFEQSLYILRNALSTYSQVARSSKPILLTPRMIGISN